MWQLELTVKLVRWLGVLGGLSGCTARPDRVDPADYPGADDDGVEAPIPNNCATLVEAFDVVGTGFVERAASGYGVYEYRAAPDQQTSIYLRACDGELQTELAIAMHFYGVSRIQPGDYTFDRLAIENGGFIFAYTDEASDVNCSELPSGTVSITTADFDRIEGVAQVDVRCVDEATLGKIPRESSFQLNFSASNIGVE